MLECFRPDGPVGGNNERAPDHAIPRPADPVERCVDPARGIGRALHARGARPEQGAEHRAGVPGDQSAGQGAGAAGRLRDRHGAGRDFPAPGRPVSASGLGPRRDGPDARAVSTLDGLLRRRVRAGFGGQGARSGAGDAGDEPLWQLRRRDRYPVRRAPTRSVSAGQHVLGGRHPVGRGAELDDALQAGAAAARVHGLCGPDQRAPRGQAGGGKGCSARGGASWLAARHRTFLEPPPALQGICI